MAITQECCELYWASPGGQPPQNSSSTATYQPSRTLSKLDEPDMRGNCWRNKYELINDVLPWTLSHGRVKVGRPARTYLQQLCANPGCSLEDLLGPMDNRDRWPERVREIRARSVTWCWCDIKLGQFTEEIKSRKVADLNEISPELIKQGNLVWYGLLVLWHINLCRLFNAKSIFI